MESGRRHVRGSFLFKIEHNDNGSFVASVIQTDDKPEEDDVGALYYVIVVIFIYGCSILMMIASYIRKNKMDRKLNRYLKEMASVRKREQQAQLLSAAAKAAAQTRKSICVDGNDEVFLDPEARHTKLCGSYSSISSGGQWSLKMAEIGRNQPKHVIVKETLKNVSYTSGSPDRRHIPVDPRDPISDNDSLAANDVRVVTVEDPKFTSADHVRGKGQGTALSTDNRKLVAPEIRITEQK